MQGRLKKRHKRQEGIGAFVVKSHGVRAAQSATERLEQDRCRMEKVGPSSCDLPRTCWGEKISDMTKINLGEIVIGVATGSGAPGLTATSRVGNMRKVIGLDISD